MDAGENPPSLNACEQRALFEEPNTGGKLPAKSDVAAQLAYGQKPGTN